MPDANHTKALGLPIATLLLALLPLDQMIFVGDNQHVVDLFSSCRALGDLFLFYCIELTRDLIGNCEFQATWVPRDLND